MTRLESDGEEEEEEKKGADEAPVKNRVRMGRERSSRACIVTDR